MSQGVNLHIILGHVGNDPEVTGEDASMIAKVRVAVSRKRKIDGELQDETQWFNVVAFGKDAEIVAKYVTKGDQIAVQGRVQTREYEDKDGAKKYWTETVANPFGITLISGGHGDDSAEDEGKSF